MSKQQYFSSYKSPNIYIVPSASICYPPSPKKPKVEKPVRDKSPQNIDVSFLDDFDVDEIVNCLNDCDDNAQNIAKQQNISNNNDIILEQDCSKNSLEIANINERNELKYIEGNNEELMIVIENTHTNNTIEKEVKVSLNINDENKHADVHIEEEGAEIYVSQITKQLKDETYNTTDNSLPNYSSNMENKTENINNQEIKEEIVKKCLLQTEQDSASTNKAPKPFDGDDNTEDNIGCNTIMKTIDNNGCKDVLECSDVSELQNKDSTTPMVEIESTIDNNHEVLNSFASKNLNNIDNLEKVKNIEDSFKAQESIVNHQVLHQNDELKLEILEKFMFQYLHKQYCMISLIHTGQYSKIFKCKDSEDKHYAVKMQKFVLFSEKKVMSIEKKICGVEFKEIHSQIQGIPKENLLCVFLICGFSLNNNWCYLTDFYPKNLRDLLKESKKNLNIDTIQDLAGQLVGAVTTLRNKNIVHSDINPSHVLLDCTNSKLRLCGFDVAYYIEDANLFPYKGTECYRAPEVILGYSAGFSLDVWSTALVLHEMATGIQLFGGWVGTHVLYKQICILGDIPPQMLLKSRYRNIYPIEYCFDDNRCLQHTHNTMVRGKNKIASTIQGAYYSHWTEGKNCEQISNDMQKIRQFIRLLEKMLVIYPEQRLPIEFVYSNPFIYKVFNN